MPSLKKPEHLIEWTVVVCVCLLIGSCTVKEMALYYHMTVKEMSK